MSENRADDILDKYSNVWTLRFISEEDEEGFTSETYKNMSVPYFIRFCSYAGLTFHIVYRLLAFGSTFINIGMAHADPEIEISLLAILLSAYIFEAIIRIYDICRNIHGLIVYAILPIVLITAAFYTQKTPYFGVAYFFYYHIRFRSTFALMVTQAITSVIVRSWLVALAGNGIVTFYSLGFYISLFYYDTSVCIFLIILAT